MELGLILGVGIFSFLICYFSFKLDDKHHLLRVLGLFFFVFSLILLPKVAIDNNNYCNIEISNTTIQGNITSYEYVYFCSPNTNTTDTAFYKLVIGFVSSFAMYVLVYLSYFVLEFAKNSIGKK